MNDDPSPRFEQLRPSLLRLAYRMLGVAAEAEDAVQDAYLRWHAAPRSAVENDAAYLRAAVTRLALDRLRSARARRESYIGPWLPEPIVDDAAVQPEEAAALADDVSFALLVVLERLSPLERAAFLLHDVLSVPFDEIAAALGRTTEACRRLASRAREHLRDARRSGIPKRSDMIRLRDEFALALRDDDPLRFAQLLSDDVVTITDAGGRKIAALNPIVGVDRVTRFLFGLMHKYPGAYDLVPASINGLPGFVMYVDGELDATIAFDFTADRIAAMYVVRNPDKLALVQKVFFGGR